VSALFDLQVRRQQMEVEHKLLEQQKREAELAGERERQVGSWLGIWRGMRGKLVAGVPAAGTHQLTQQTDGSGVLGCSAVLYVFMSLLGRLLGAGTANSG